jgi:hypothetical protein
VSRPLRVAFGDRRVCVKEPAVNSKVEEELIAVAAEWDRAMVENDAEAIGLYMADDWAILDLNGGVTDKATYLGLVTSGVLRHDGRKRGQEEKGDIQDYRAEPSVAADGGLESRIQPGKSQQAAAAELCVRRWERHRPEWQPRMCCPSASPSSAVARVFTTFC